MNAALAEKVDISKFNTALDRLDRRVTKKMDSLEKYIDRVQAAHKAKASSTSLYVLLRSSPAVILRLFSRDLLMTKPTVKIMAAPTKTLVRLAPDCELCPGVSMSFSLFEKSGTKVPSY